MLGLPTVGFHDFAHVVTDVCANAFADVMTDTVANAPHTRMECHTQDADHVDVCYNRFA